MCRHLLLFYLLIPWYLVLHAGTSVYCLADQRVAVSLSERIAKLTAHHEGEDLKDVRHFPCTFVNKPVDVTQWYQ